MRPLPSYDQAEYDRVASLSKSDLVKIVDRIRWTFYAEGGRLVSEPYRDNEAFLAETDCVFEKFGLKP